MTRTERQELAIEKWKKAGCRGSVIAATGTGKTRIALKCISRVLNKNPSVKTVVVVPTRVLKDQWEKEIEEFFEGEFVNIEVKVLKTASMKKFYCNFLVIDESHTAAAASLRNVFKNCNPTFILGLTATYERLDGQEKEVLDKYCPPCDEITLQEATKNGWLSPYKEYRILVDVDLTEYNNANRSFMNNFAVLNFDFNLGMMLCSNPIKLNQYAAQMGMKSSDLKKVVYAWNKALQFRKSFIINHPKKLEIAKKIIEARKDKKIITFNSSVKQCEEYGDGYIVHSKNTKKKNQAIIDEFSKMPSACLHSVKMLEAGLNVPDINVGIAVGFTSSKISAVQTRGRCLRFEPNKEAEFFTIILKGTQEEKWAKKAAEGLSYIEIDESELEDILNNKDINRKSKIQEKEIKNRLITY